MNERASSPISRFRCRHTQAYGARRPWACSTAAPVLVHRNVLGYHSARASIHSNKLMQPGSEWEVIGISHCHWRMLATALVLGGNIRTGLEDHLYLPDGSMARSNGEMVEVAVRQCRDMGRRPATVDEARQILSLSEAR